MVILGVGQLWPPKEVYPMVSTAITEIVEYVVHLLVGKVKASLIPSQDFLVFEYERGGEDDLDRASVHCP
jgi:hypothetical protein